MIRYITALFMVIFFAVGLQAEERVGSYLISKTDTATVNWTEGVLTAVGRGEPPEDYYGDEKGREMALSAAIENAKGKLMEVLRQISVDAQDTVADVIEREKAARLALMEMVDNAEVVHQEFTTDGTVAVTVQMSMNGGFSQLVLPEVVKQIESVKPIAGASVSSSGDETDGVPVSGDDTAPGSYTGMIIDMRGIDVMPCMVPRVCDENGQEVFGPAYASREFAVQRGITGYMSDMETAITHTRVAGRPLILKGIRTCGVGGTDIIVSNTDAARLRSAFENLAFLRQCRVMIVLDVPDTSGEG